MRSFRRLHIIFGCLQLPVPVKKRVAHTGPRAQACMPTQDYCEGDIWYFPENTAHTVVALDDGCYFLTGARMHHIARLAC